MPSLDPDRLLALLRDPAVESLEIANLAGVPREEAGRAARLLAGLARAKPEDVVSLPGPLAVAIGRAAAGAGRADLLVALAGHASKDVAKEAKRGLHLLKTRGVAVPELPPPAPPPVAAAAPEPPPPAFASAPDGRGERGLWLSRHVPGKGIEIAQAVVSDERGLVHLQVGLLGRKEWRAFAASLLERGVSMGIAELPAAEVHAVITSARALNERSGERLPDGAELWLSRLGPPPAPPAEAPAPPALAPLPPDEEAAVIAASGELHELPLFRGWLAPEPHLRATAAKLDEVAVSQLYVDDRQKAAQAERLLADAAEAWLDPAARARVAARLLTAARHLALAGDAAHARVAAATARALEAGKPAAGIPFARALVEKAFPPAEPPPEAGSPTRIDPGITLR